MGAYCSADAGSGNRNLGWGDPWRERNSEQPSTKPRKKIKHSTIAVRFIYLRL